MSMSDITFSLSSETHFSHCAVLNKFVYCRPSIYDSFDILRRINSELNGPRPSPRVSVA